MMVSNLLVRPSIRLWFLVAHVNAFDRLADVYTSRAPSPSTFRYAASLLSLFRIVELFDEDCTRRMRRVRIL